VGFALLWERGPARMRRAMQGSGSHKSDQSHLRGAGAAGAATASAALLATDYTDSHGFSFNNPPRDEAEVREAWAVRDGCQCGTVAEVGERGDTGASSRQRSAPRSEERQAGSERKPMATGRRHSGRRPCFTAGDQMLHTRAGLCEMGRRASSTNTCGGRNPGAGECRDTPLPRPASLDEEARNVFENPPSRAALVRAPARPIFADARPGGPGPSCLRASVASCLSVEVAVQGRPTIGGGRPAFWYQRDASPARCRAASTSATRGRAGDRGGALRNHGGTETRRGKARRHEGTKARRFFLCALCGLCGLMMGCAGRPVAIPDVTPVQQGLARADAFVHAAAGSVEAAIPHSNATGQAHLASASRSLTGASGAIEEGGVALDGLRVEIVALKVAYEAAAARVKELTASFWSVRQIRLFWIAVGILAAACALRLFGLWATGGAGKLASFVGTALLGILTGGGSLIQAVFDNLWFRWRRPRLTAEAAEGRGGTA
jgi:hypothetical protein